MRNRSENQIKLVLIRHGAAKSNKERRYLGKTDEPLSEEGKRELSVYREQKIYPKVDHLFISPMKRCVETAEILYPHLTPVFIEEWKEMDFGAFEGKNYEELKGNADYQRWIDSGGILPFPQGESREDFIKRCREGFLKMLSDIRQVQKDGKAQNNSQAQEGKRMQTIGMIVHGGTIMALLGSYGDGDYFDYQAANGRGYVCTCQVKGQEIKLTLQKKL